MRSMLYTAALAIALTPHLYPASALASELAVGLGETCTMDRESIALLADIRSGAVVPKDARAGKPDLIALTPQESNNWIALKRTIESTQPPYAAAETGQGTRSLFVAVFDGTWNDRDDATEPLTVPGQLSRDLEASQLTEKNIRTYYYEGVGTRVWFGQRWFEGAFGYGTAGRADRAMADLKHFLAEHRDDPAFHPYIYVIGFSRGAASARHFLNLAAALPEPVHSSAILFDTVAQSSLESLNLGFPETTDSVLHLIAGRENRLSFPVVPATGKSAVQAMPGFAEWTSIFEFVVPGAHSDIGGGYAEGLQNITLHITRLWLRKQGLVVDLPAFDEQAFLNVGRHNSDWPLTPLARSIKLAFTDGKRSEIQIATKPSKEHLSVDEMIAKSSSEILSLQAQLLQARADRAAGKAQNQHVLAVQIEYANGAFQVRSSCAGVAQLDEEKGWLSLSGQRVDYFSPEEIDDMKRSFGILLYYYPRNPDDWVRVPAPQAAR